MPSGPRVFQVPPDPQGQNRTRAAAALDAAALILLVLGESAGGVFLPDRLWLSLSPFFWLGVGLVAARHVIWPHPSWFTLARSSVRAFSSRPGTGQVWLITVASRLAVLLVGAVAVTTAGPSAARVPFRVSANAIENLPARFDAGWYLSIARLGYDWNEALRGHRNAFAFLPAFPAAMRVAGDLLTLPAKAARHPGFLGGGNARVLWGGVLVSVLCFGLALQNLRALCALDGAGEREQARAAMMAAAYPFALYFSAPYTEALTLFGLTGTVLALRQGLLLRAGSLGILTGLARSNGWTLSVALLAAWMIDGRSSSRRTARFFVALCPLAGLGGYLAWVFRRTGNAMDWVWAQGAWGATLKPLAFWARQYDAIGRLGLAGYLRHETVEAVTLACVLWMIGMAALMLWRRQWLYGCIIACYLAPALAVDLLSIGRMTAVLFPAFIAAAGMFSGRGFLAVATVLAGGQAYFAWRFFLWLPPF
jgi:hypothetical protein